GEGFKITDAGTHSMRFPAIVDMAIDGGSDLDTVCIMYLDDSIAGFFLYSEGAASPNPVVVHKIPALGGAVAEQRPVVPVKLDALATPNPFGRSTRISYDVPQRGDVSLDIFDATGRNVRTLVNGRSEPGRFSVNWDGRSQSGASVSEGVYLYRYSLNGRNITGKLTLTR
ncbi:T9SS type A sorting domain-containing protein, partial [candidate division WOR-3 bacterium]|nr:T9SS type A sorting domain-containing protein [candidate division WOR-3 bacterium]